MLDPTFPKSIGYLHHRLCLESHCTLYFTFDAISGEREHGTLRLMLANAIPRHTVLIGKFLGALISTSYSLYACCVGEPFDAFLGKCCSPEYLKRGDAIGIILFIALLYTCLFLALGLLVSARVQRSAVSLVILLLTWVTFVVFMPSTLASLASGFSSSMARHEYFDRYGQSYHKLRRTWRYAWYQSNDEEMLRIRGEWHTKMAISEERVNSAYLTFKISQVQRARVITSISPAALLQHLLEAFAGTGLDRHQQFTENAQRYAREYREFVVDMERGDPESRHIMGVREGMSQKPVNPEAVPRFEDTRNIGKDFNTAATKLLLLTLFVVVLLAGAYLAFVRVEI